MAIKLVSALKLSEKEIEKDILQYLSMIPNVKVWKQNSIGVFDSKANCFRLPRSRFIIRGVSDIIGVLRGTGQFLAIEVKTPQRRNQLSPDQKYFIDSINEFGGIAFVATCIDDVYVKRLDRVKD